MVQKQRAAPARPWLAIVAAAGAGASITPAARAQSAWFTGEPSCSALTMAGGNYPDGEGWYIEDSGVIQTGPFRISAETAASLPDELIRGYARVTASITPGMISVSANAQAYVGPGMVVESFTTSATVLTRVMIPEDTPFFIRRSGTLPASITPVTGAIEGATLRAGTYDLAGFAWASRRFPGTITLSGTYSIILADCIPDWDDDGDVGSDDVSAYLENWIADVTQGTAQCDLTGDGEVTSSDISVFLAMWLPASISGC